MLTSSGNNIESEPGDQAIRVIKYQFNMTAESYIPQPITRDKAVLSMRTDVVEGFDDDIVSIVPVGLKGLTSDHQRFFARVTRSDPRKI